MASDQDEHSVTDSLMSLPATSDAIERLDQSWRQLHHDWTTEHRSFQERCRRLNSNVLSLKEELLVTKSQKSAVVQQLQNNEQRVDHLERLTRMQQQTIENLERDQETNLETLRCDFVLATQRTDRAQKQVAALQELLDLTSESTKQDWQSAQKLIEAEKQISRQEHMLGTVKRKQVEAESRTSEVVARLQKCEQELALATKYRQQAEDALQQSREQTQAKEKECNKASRNIRRLEKRLRQKSLHQETEVRLQKLEICELEATLAEVRTDNTHLQQAAMAAKVQQESSASSITEAEKRIQSSERRAKILNDKISAFAAKAHALKAGKSLAAELSHLKLRPDAVCALTHSQFTHLTDCGRLLCDDCAQSTTTVSGRLPDSQTARQCFEFDTCPWCNDDTWGWQRLVVPYSMHNMEDILRFCQMTEAFWEDLAGETAIENVPSVDMSLWAS